MKFTVQAACGSHVGKRRSNNEDNFLFDGKLKAVTFSYDDAVTQDIRFIELLDKYNLKCTFNINSELLGKENDIICNSVEKKMKVSSIEEAEILVVAGSAIKDEKGMELIKQFADAINASVAVTRPLVEKGLGHVNQQIGLSGRTVKPKLIITCGVSGAIQFTAGMKDSEKIVAINNDPNAPIFELAHYAIVDDIYAFIPKLLAKMKEGKE